MVSKITTAYFALLSLSLASLCIATVDGSEKSNCNTLMAVFTYQDALNYIYGSGSTIKATIKESSGKVLTFPVPFLEGTTAGVGYADANSDEIYFMYGRDSETGQPTDLARHRSRPLTSSGAEKELLKTREFVEIDAAFAGPNSIITYFEGCEFIAVDAKGRTVEAKGKNSDLNLPCDVDAAWGAPDDSHAFIVKGDKLWVLPVDRATAHRADLYTAFPEMKRFDLCSPGK